jgi:hypothetical protein
MFTKMHEQMLSMGSNNSTEQTTRVFAESFVKEWFSYRGQGHYSIIKRIFGYLFIANIIDTDKIAMDYIVSYLTAIIIEFTRDHKVDLLEYFNKVYRHIIDVWGFLTVYLSILELLAENYKRLNKYEVRLYDALKSLVLTQMYEPRIKPNNINELVKQIKGLNPLFKKCADNVSSVDFKVSSSSPSTSTTSIMSKSASSLTKKRAEKMVSQMFSKTRKNR